MSVCGRDCTISRGCRRSRAAPGANRVVPTRLDERECEPRTKWPAPSREPRAVMREAAQNDSEQRLRANGERRCVIAVQYSPAWLSTPQSPRSRPSFQVCLHHVRHLIGHPDLRLSRHPAMCDLKLQPRIRTSKPLSAPRAAAMAGTRVVESLLPVEGPGRRREFGGGGGNRTRVRIASNERVYVCRLRIISVRAASKSWQREPSSS